MLAGPGRMAGGWPDPAWPRAAPARSQADAVKGEATLSVAGGFARLVIKLADDVDSQVTAAGTIVVIRFRRPVAIPVGRLADAVPDYISSARADPDGSAIRLSLARKVTVNTMTAGERVFVDFLPDGWTGPPPGLPQEVVRELSERARAAERALRQQRADAEAKKRPPVRVRASVQPTFVRFVFEMPEGVGVSSVLNEQKLTLLFNAAADLRSCRRQGVGAAERRLDQPEDRRRYLHSGSRTDRRRRCAFVPRGQELRRRRRLPAIGKVAGRVTARIGRATGAGAGRAGRRGTCRRPVAQEPAPLPAEVTPPTSEAIAQQAKIEIKPETAAQDRAAATAARHAIAEGSPGCDLRRRQAGAVCHATAGDGSAKEARRGRRTAGSLRRRQIRRPGGTSRQRRPAR